MPPGSRSRYKNSIFPREWKIESFVGRVGIPNAEDGTAHVHAPNPRPEGWALSCFVNRAETPLNKQPQNEPRKNLLSFSSRVLKWTDMGTRAQGKQILILSPHHHRRSTSYLLPCPPPFLIRNSSTSYTHKAYIRQHRTRGRPVTLFSYVRQVATQKDTHTDSRER